MSYAASKRDLALSILADPQADRADREQARRDLVTGEPDITKLNDQELDTLIAISQKLEGRAPDRSVRVVVVDDYMDQVATVRCTRCRQFSDEDLQVLREAVAEDAAEPPILDGEPVAALPTGGTK